MKISIRLSAILLLITTIFLKITGLVRDMLIANYFGNSYMADAYLAAFIVPNMLILFMQNGMKNAFVPNFYVKKQQNKETFFFNNLIKGTWIIGLLISVSGIILAPMIIQVLYPAFNVETATIATGIIRIFMSVMVVICVNAILESYLDANHKYHVSTISQSIVWLTMIIITILFAEKVGVYILAIGYFTGVILSFIFKWLILKDTINQKSKLKKAEIKTFYKQLIPLGLTVMVGQVNLAVDNVFASYFQEGVITYVNYAKNVVHFPQTIIAVVVGTVFFSIIADSFAKKEIQTFHQHIHATYQINYFLTLPAITGLAFILPYLIEMLFERGAFPAQATMETTKVGYFYLGSAFFFSLNIVWNKALYTMGKGALILKISIISIVLNVIGNFIFTQWLSYYGIPLASSLVGLYYTVTTYAIYKKHATTYRIWNKEIMKITVANLIMCAVLAITLLYVDIESTLWKGVTLVLIGACTYLISVKLLKSTSWNTLFAQVKGERS